MDLGLTKRCDFCYALVKLRDGVISITPAPNDKKRTVPAFDFCTQEQFDANACPVCHRPMLMVVY